MAIQLLYFARLREQLGTASEQIDPGDAIHTVNDVLEMLAARGGSWQVLLHEQPKLLCAINQEMANRNAPVADGDEVAFFPPVTGG